MLRKLKASAVAEESYLVWNAFIDLLAMEEYEQMSTLQKRAHLLFWYDSAVQNGGHHQYFENSAGRRCHETVEALRELGLVGQARVLGDAIQRWESKKRKRPRSIKKLVAAFLEGKFGQCDDAYHACSPTVMKKLEDILANNQEEFVIIE
jgi:hypothetical protein